MTAPPRLGRKPSETLHNRTAKGLPYETKVKTLYSGKGLYVLMEATDKKITATF